MQNPSSQNAFKIVPDTSYSRYGEPRYIIVGDNNQLLDDAQGHGYTSYKKAYRCAIFKIKNNMSFTTGSDEIPHIE